MPFRDDLEALRDRVETLERENKRLEAQLEREARARAGSRGAGPRPWALRWVVLGTGLGVLNAAVLLIWRGHWVMAVPAEAVGFLLLTRGLTGHLVVVAGPHQALVISGPQRRTAGGERVGYRLVLDGSTVHFPFLERVESLSLEPRAVESFLGVSPEKIVAAARQAREPSLREALASYDPARPDPDTLHQRVKALSADGLDRLGLELDGVSLEVNRA
jgi:hypothetical protein